MTTGLRSELAACAAVAVGGAIGSLARVLLEQLGAAASPWPSIIINVVGSLLLGVLAGAVFGTAPRWLIAGLGTGLLGGFTTMSGLAVHALLLAGSDGAGFAAGYLLASLVLGLGGALLGFTLGQRWRRERAT